MEDFLIGFVDGGAGAELEEAAGVGGGDDGCVGGFRVVHFFGEQLEGCFGLGDVVDSGGTAANLRAGQFD